MRFALWIAGAFLTMLSLRIGWTATVIAVSPQSDPLVYGLAMQQVTIAALFLIAGCVLLGAGCIVEAIRRVAGASHSETGNPDGHE